jgi:hypothetical protein
MKKLFAITIGALMVVTVARAQFVQGPARYNLFTNAGVIFIPGETTTNFPVTMALSVPVGANGIAFYLGLGATNAASTTNATIIVESLNIDSKNGFTNVIDNQTYTLSVPQNGVTRYDYLTNLVNTTANLGNAPSLRIRSLQNTNVLGIFITNAVVYVR